MNEVGLFIKSMVRPFIAVMVTGTIVYLCFIGRIDAKEILAAFSFITGFYFGERANIAQERK